MCDMAHPGVIWPIQMCDNGPPRCAPRHVVPLHPDVHGHVCSCCTQACTNPHPCCIQVCNHSCAPTPSTDTSAPTPPICAPPSLPAVPGLHPPLCPPPPQSSPHPNTAPTSPVPLPPVKAEGSPGRAVLLRAAPSCYSWLCRGLLGSGRAPPCSPTCSHCGFCSPRDAARSLSPRGWESQRIKLILRGENRKRAGGGAGTGTERAAFLFNRW